MAAARFCEILSRARSDNRTVVGSSVRGGVSAGGAVMLDIKAERRRSDQVRAPPPCQQARGQRRFFPALRAAFFMGRFFAPPFFAAFLLAAFLGLALFLALFFAAFFAAFFIAGFFAAAFLAGADFAAGAAFFAAGAALAAGTAFLAGGAAFLAAGAAFSAAGAAFFAPPLVAAAAAP